jgi:hypothetical protein
MTSEGVWQTLNSSTWDFHCCSAISPEVRQESRHEPTTLIPLNAASFASLAQGENTHSLLDDAVGQSEGKYRCVVVITPCLVLVQAGLASNVHKSTVIL